MSLRESFRTLFGVPSQEYDLAEAEVETITWGGVTYNLIDFITGVGYVEVLPALKRARQMTTDTVASLTPVAYRDGVPLDDVPAIVRLPDPSLDDDREFVGETMLSLIDDGNA